MRFIRGIPFLAYVVAAYNILVFFFEETLSATLFNLELVSGAIWTFTVSDLLLTLGLIFLYFEIFKATKTSNLTIVDHGLSLLVFIICLLEFIVLDKFGTTTFFLITLMTILDVVAGFTITISTARRDFGIGAHGSDLGIT